MVILGPNNHPMWVALQSKQGPAPLFNRLLSLTLVGAFLLPSAIPSAAMSVKWPPRPVIPGPNLLLCCAAPPGVLCGICTAGSGRGEEEEAKDQIGAGKAVSAPLRSPSPTHRTPPLLVGAGRPGRHQADSPAPATSRYARAGDPSPPRLRASQKPPGAAPLSPSLPWNAAVSPDLGEAVTDLKRHLRRHRPGFLVGPSQSLHIRHPSWPLSWPLPRPHSLPFCQFNNTLKHN
ncbi:hypothetical protein NDU88_008842 [Pleurodeles waltl]|uniref:Uncharacterized protein n=1 Tax=Pleurodeles waltl TaxID=8319 RepID=A0AAV7RUB9_PLEWA|nr:hypothetical protein NDU88_008842 [Pleurodeles waltl]